MKILHIYDVAAVGKIISTELRRTWGIKSTVISRQELDDFKFAEVYKDVTINQKGRARWFALNAFKHAAFYDILHVHAWSWSIPKLRRLFPRKKIVVHFHGGEVRNNWERKRNEYKHADFVAVSTPNLLHDKPDDVEAEWVPNPIDRRHWKRLNSLIVITKRQPCIRTLTEYMIEH